MTNSKLAIDGGTPVRTTPWPAWPVLGEDDFAAVEAVLRSGKLTSLGHPQVKAFEEEYAAYHGVKHAIATNSGTAAIHAALAALGVKAGDEVIVPAHTFIGTVTPVLHQNAIPVFADVTPDIFNISPESVEALITEKTSAIIAVHLNGHPAEMDELLAIGRKHGIPVLEDACQAHGATYRGRKIGSLGAAACFSFFEDKIITTGGEGGMIVTNDDEVAARARLICNHGEGATQAGEERKYLHVMLGYNYRLPEMAAATGSVQLRQLDSYVAARQANAAYLTDRFAAFPQIITPTVREYVAPSFYKYVGRLNRKACPVPIEYFVKAVAAEGVPITRRYPTPLHRQPLFTERRGYGRSECPFGCSWHGSTMDYGQTVCPNAEALADEAFCLLVHPTETQQDLDDIVAAIGKVLSA
jgi:perosamine synthetase